MSSVLFQPLLAVLAVEVPVVIAATLMPILVAAWGSWAVGRWALDRRRAISSRVEDPPPPEWLTYDSSQTGQSAVGNSPRGRLSSGPSMAVLGAGSVAAAVVAMALAWPALWHADAAEAPNRPASPATEANPSVSPSQSAASEGNTSSAEESSGDSVTIVGTGLAQSGGYADGITVVRVNSKDAVGEFITVSVNFIDETGAILATEGHVEQAWWQGQELALVATADLGQATASRVDASVSVSDYGPERPRPPMAEIKSREVIDSGRGQITAAFEFTNNTGEKLTGLRISIACYDTAGAVVGGTSAYPDPVAAGRTVRIEGDMNASGSPASCTAFPNYGD